MADRTRPLLDRRRFLAVGLGALAAACAETADRQDPTPAAAAGSSPGSSPSPAAPSTAPRAAAPSPGSTVASPSAPAPSTPDYPTGIRPSRIRIPSIGVDAPVIDLQLTATEVEVPQDFDDAGWWVQTREPGEIGPAVIGGHVDSTTGPAVFFRLDELRVGDEVTVADDSGDDRTFVVDTEPFRVRKDQRPPEVFGFGEGRPELRLITCGGDFDPTTGHYVDNVVVFCHMEGVEL